MIYGFLIGVMIASLFVRIANNDTSRDHRRPENIVIIRALTRMYSNSFFIVAASTLIGLLIRGA